MAEGSAESLVPDDKRISMRHQARSMEAGVLVPLALYVILYVAASNFGSGRLSQPMSWHVVPFVAFTFFGVMWTGFMFVHRIALIFCIRVLGDRHIDMPVHYNDVIGEDDPQPWQAAIVFCSMALAILITAMFLA